MKNLAILIGNLGADPELKYTQNGTPVATFNMATSERWKDQQGQQQEHTEWHRIVVWRRLAELVNEYLHKGSKIYLEGKIQTRKWQDQNGIDRYTTEIIAREMKFLDGPQNRQQGHTQNQGGNQQNPGRSGVLADNPGYTHKQGGNQQSQGQQSQQGNYYPEPGPGTGDGIPF